MLLVSWARAAMGETAGWRLENPSDREYREELVRLRVRLSPPFDATRLGVTEDGRTIPYQVEVHEGGTRNVMRGDVWVRTTVARGGSHEYVVTTDSEPAKFESAVKVTEGKEGYVLGNGLVEVKLPSEATGPDRPPGPITAVRLEGQDWVGSSQWRSSVRCLMLQPRVVARGPLFAQVELLYFFADPSYAGRVPFAAVTVRLNAGERIVRVVESHDMYEGDHWLLDLGQGMGPTRALIVRGDGNAKEGEWNSFGEVEKSIAKLGPSPGNANHALLLGAIGSRSSLAIAADSTVWDRPPDNAIAPKPNRTGSGGLLDLPTWRGGRSWLLIVSPSSEAPRLDALRRAAMIESLDRMLDRNP